MCAFRRLVGAEVGKKHNQLSLVAAILCRVWIRSVQVWEGVWDGGILTGDNNSNNIDLRPFLASHRIFKPRLAIVLVKSHVLGRIC